MATITIKNVGPIKEVINLELNKVNIFMGPQSSGKSTIAKIISFCAWVEKNVSLAQSFSFFEKGNNFINDFFVFHKLKDYFRNDSKLEYESDIIKFKYDHQNGKPHFEWKNRYDYKRSKISYIPSERNLVSAIENWFEVRFTENNILNFMKEWEDARKIYTKGSPLSILGLGVQYYYDEKSGQDFVIVDKKDTTLELTNTSSGLQSIIPLMVVTEYITLRIYEKGNIKRSVRNEQIEFFIREKIYDELFKENNQKTAFPPEGGQMNIYVDSSTPWHIEGIPSTPTTIANKKEELQKNHWLRIFKSEEEQKKFINKTNCFLDAQCTQFIIEEPEQNLFPETQQELIYYLLEKLQSEREHRLTITTHSPYVLYALNNCMLGYLVKGKMLKDEDYTDLKSLKSSIEPAKVSVWQITDEGTISNIQGEDKLIENNYFDACMKEVMDDYYKMINYYGDEDED